MNSPFLNAASWQAEVDKMIKAFGAPIDEADAKVIIEYLELRRLRASARITMMEVSKIGRGGDRPEPRSARQADRRAHSGNRRSRLGPHQRPALLSQQAPIGARLAAPSRV